MNRETNQQAPTGQDVTHIKDLVPDPKNRRAHNPRNIGMVVDALQSVGAARSIVIDEDNVILAGNGVTEAAAEAGITAVRVIEATGNEIIAVRRSGLTEEQKRHLAIADNRSAELAQWSAAQFKDDLGKGLSFEKFFTKQELTKIVGAGAKGGLTDPDEVPAERPTGIVGGDLFELGRHRLLCGDSTQTAAVAALLDLATPDVVVTDPPYCSGGFQEAGKASGSVGTRSDEMVANDTLSTRGYIALMKAALGLLPVKAIYVFTDWRMWINLFDVAESSGYGVRNMIVWDKQTPGMGIGWRMQHELILVGVKISSPFDPHKAQGNVIQCKRTGNVLHATQKPTELIEKILDVTTWADIVADPFAGSGTTLMACQTLGRSCLAMELTPRYCQVIIDRWEAFTGQKAQKVGEAVRS